MTENTSSFDAAEYIRNPDDAAAFIKDAIASGHKEYIINCLTTIARAYDISVRFGETGDSASTEA